ncbi:hypothetical protein C2E21_5429 [Chlorella sorokiniana]|uniref:Uncharacterized protein n=1 Tax=Chlorella sorokiniana TaxID=3076 RepID=A0A2P6TP03_CHLSO|nr:hypothetical protein C2E21_5429 [Chlorella sorokiniana]|eukprot:PRW51039.1 hypothetical protein C2E21_5429 [Chlorella sorokiniana]
MVTVYGTTTFHPAGWYRVTYCTAFKWGKFTRFLAATLAIVQIAGAAFVIAPAIYLSKDSLPGDTCFCSSLSSGLCPFLMGTASTSIALSAVTVVLTCCCCCTHRYSMKWSTACWVWVLDTLCAVVPAVMWGILYWQLLDNLQTCNDDTVPNHSFLADPLVSGSAASAAQLKLQDKAHFNHNTRDQIKMFSLGLCALYTFVALLALLRRACCCHVGGERDRKENEDPDYEWHNASATTTFTSV